MTKIKAYNLDFPGIHVEELSERKSGSEDFTSKSPFPQCRPLGYEFASQVTINLNILRSKALGSQLLKEISLGCTDRKLGVMILYGKTNNAGAYPSVGNDAADECTDPDQKPLMIRKGDGAFKQCVKGGSGANAVVFWNPKATKGFDGSERPVYVALAHELIHAHHYLHASCSGVISNKDIFESKGKGKTAHGDEERRTIGCEVYEDEKMSENAFRALYGLPLRKAY